MEPNLISIIVPVYNSEKYIKECLDSLINQSYKNIEIIVVDDGSDDTSKEIIQSICKRDNRVKYFYKKNSGVSETRNYGISKAKGNYISYVDSDDWISLVFIEEAMNYMLDNNLDIIIGGTEKNYKNHTDRFCINSKKIKIYSTKELKYIENKIVGYETNNLPELNNCFMSGAVCKIFRRENIKNIFFDPLLSLGEDTIYNIETIRQSKKIGICPNIWYHYRMNEESATQKFNPNLNENIKNTLIKLKEMKVEKKYFYKRALLSLNGVFECYPFHRDAELSFLEKKKITKQIAEEEFWSEVLNNIKTSYFSEKKFKLITLLLKNKMFTTIAIIYSIKQNIKSKKKKV